MKSVFVISAIAAGLALSAPASAEAAGLSVGMKAHNGDFSGHLTLVDHDRRNYRDRRRHGRFRCLNWHRAHRRLHRRFDYVRLQRRVYNRRGHRVFIARARNHHGRPVRVRYNACTRRITRVTPVRRHYRGHRYDRRRHEDRRRHR